jgi:hypothetical protein
MAKKIDPKAKAKKQKIYAAVGGVLLLGVLAFQVPRTLKMMHPQTENGTTAAASAPTSTTSSPIAAPSLAGGNATAVSAPAAVGELGNPDALPLPQSGQLLAFGLFRTKDPFAQQLRDTCVASTDPAGGDTASACPATTTASSAEAPAKTTPPKASSEPPSRGTTPAPAAAAVTTAIILVNGDSQSVQAGSQFPTADPVFTLVSLTATTAKIGIAGGTLESGSQSVTLKKNKPVTLMNTADGTRYVVRLVSTS